MTRQTAKREPEPSTVYRYEGQKWNARSAPATVKFPVIKEAALPRGFKVVLEESANDPPVMTAIDGRRRVALTASDPALEGLWRAPAEKVEWQEPNGKTAQGLLMLPRDRSPSTPLPLVVQGFHQSPNAFRPDGVVLSGFAAQALVAQGFAVLQIDFAYDDPSTFMTPGELPPRVARLDAAVEMLATKGIVDASKVALVGFSRSGYSTYYVLSHPGRVRPAAAVIFDSITAGYGEYVNLAGLGDPAPEYEKQYGEGAFWENKQAWLEAPAFNVDRITTPTLFSSTGPSYPIASLETIGAWRYINRAFEFQHFPQGSHQLQRPVERVASMQSTVDWINFWLMDRDPAPSKDDPERAARWQKIRSNWQAQLAREATGQAADPKVH